MTAYQPEQWHDAFVPMAGAAAACWSRSIADAAAGYARLAAGRLTQSVGCPAEWKGRDARLVTEEASVTSDWFRAGVR